MTASIVATDVVNMYSVALRLQGQDCSNRLFVEFDAEVPVNATFDLIGAVMMAVVKLLPTNGAKSPALIHYVLGDNLDTFTRRWYAGNLDPQSLKLGYYKITAKEAKENLTIAFTLESQRAFPFDRSTHGNYRDLCLLINEVTPYYGEISGRVNIESGVSILNISYVGERISAHMRLQGRLELLSVADQALPNVENRP